MADALKSRELAPDVERLASVDWEFADQTARDLTHALHPWPAKFIPQIPAAVIECCCMPGDTVLDPFVGCGTTAVEALRRGCNADVSDVNPLAARITEAKCDPPTGSDRKAIQSWSASLPVVQAADVISDLVPEIPNIDYWFDPDVIAQLSVIRSSIAQLDRSTAFLEVLFSSIILRASHQESETRYRRVERSISAEDVLTDFRTRVKRGLAMAEQWDPVRKDISASATVSCRDARRPSSGSVKGDLAVFSPPYPNAFDYHLYHRFRMFWLGFDPREVKKQEIGAHLRYLDAATWRADMRAVIEALFESLGDGALCVSVIGDGLIDGKVVRSSEIFVEEATDIGLELELDIVRPVALSRKSFNLSDSRLRSEHVVVLRR